MRLADDLRAWHDFFLLSGGASATLMGLVFVSVSLAPAFKDKHEAARERGLFVTPTIFQFSYVLGISAVSVAPWTDVHALGWITLVAGSIALAQCLYLLRGMWVRHRVDPVPAHYWVWNGAWPLLASALWATNGVLTLAIGVYRPELVAISTLTLELLGVSNAWRLMNWIIAERNRETR